MNKANRKRIWKEETAKFEQFMYDNGLEDITDQCSPYHWKIITTEKDINIFPSTRKFYIKGMQNASRYYNLNELKKYL